VKSPRTKVVSLHSHNRLLTGWQHRVIGKTGYTRPAGRCFVGSATSDGREVVIALLGSSDLWGDARRLFAYAFGEPAERPLVQTASARRGRGGRGARITTEGDEDVAERTKERRKVHIASAKSLRETSTGRRPSVDRYTVRLGPYSTRREAEAARSRLAKRGYRARVVGQALIVGEYANRSGADRLAKGLKSKGYRPTIVSAR
jgi:D-alanyl-D-alanine carboxypeptidase